MSEAIVKAVGHEGVLGGLPNDDWTSREGDVNVNGLRLHVLDARRRLPTAKGRTMVMLHGMSSHGDAWRPVVASMSAIDRVICPDMRGHGQSEWADGYWLADYANDIVALLDVLEVDEVDIIGQSLGARVAMVLGTRLGARLRTMILLDTGPEVSRSAAEKARSVVASSMKSRGFRNEEELKESLRRLQPEWTDVSIDIRAARLYRQNWAGKLINRCDPDVGWLLGGAGLVECDAMWGGLRATSASVCIIRAKESFLLDDDLAKRMCDATSDATYIEMSCGHYIPYQEPELLASVVDDFLRTHRPEHS